MTFDEIVAEYESNVADLSPNEHMLLRAAYEAGLRRAQELAKKSIDVDYVDQFSDFDQAIDAEANKP